MSRQHPYLFHVHVSAKQRGVFVRWIPSGRIGASNNVVYRLWTHTFQIVVKMRDAHLGHILIVDERSDLRQEVAWPVTWCAGMVTLTLPSTWQVMLEYWGWSAELELDGVNVGRVTGEGVAAE